MLITTVYQEVKLRNQRRGTCIVCGKKRIRKFSESNTVNPWNKNEDGTVRSYSQVRERVCEKLKDFLEKFDKRGFKCAKCEDALWMQ